MINLFPNYQNKQRMFREQGGATFLIAIILLVVSTMIVIFAANIGRNYDKLVANQARSKEAYEAAEAGFEFGINYLKKQATTITANPVSGHINYSDSSTTNITLSNNSRYTVVYTNPIANNYNLILVTATGTNADNTATRVIQQQIQSQSILSNFGTNALTSKGVVNVGGNGIINNTLTNQTIETGLGVVISGSGSTIISTGTGSNASTMGSDVQQNSTTLANMSESDFFSSFFGTTNTASVQSQMANYFSNSTDTNYNSTLSGKEGTSIWIDQTAGSTATINSNTTIGSAANPVLLVVNGNLSISGNVTIYGFVYILGSSGISTLSGNITITGGLASTSDITISGNSSLTYDQTVLNNLTSNNALKYYAKVSGTWRDY